MSLEAEDLARIAKLRLAGTSPKLIELMALSLEGYGTAGTRKVRTMLDQFEERGWSDAHGDSISYAQWREYFAHDPSNEIARSVMRKSIGLVTP